MKPRETSWCRSLWFSPYSPMRCARLIGLSVSRMSRLLSPRDFLPCFSLNLFYLAQETFFSLSLRASLNVWHCFLWIEHFGELFCMGNLYRMGNETAGSSLCSWKNQLNFKIPNRVDSNMPLEIAVSTRSRVKISLHPNELVLNGIDFSPMKIFKSYKLPTQNQFSNNYFLRATNSFMCVAIKRKEFTTHGFYLWSHFNEGAANLLPFHIFRLKNHR